MSFTLSTVKEKEEPNKVKEASYSVLNDEQENALHIPAAFTIPKSMFNMLPQKLSKSARSDVRIPSSEKYKGSTCACLRGTNISWIKHT